MAEKFLSLSCWIATTLLTHNSLHALYLLKNKQALRRKMAQQQQQQQKWASRVKTSDGFGY